jgi:hypothetical protein
MYDQLKIEQLGKILPSDIKVIIDNDPALLKNADVVVIDLPIIHYFMSEDEIFEKQEGQIWVAWNLECDKNYPWIFKDEVKNFFDIWMTYHPDADIFLPYFTYEYKYSLFNPIQKKDSDKRVCMFVSSSINKSSRLEYIEELMKYVNVHSYGKWMQNHKIINDKGYTSKMEIISKYKFTIAFENACDDDYVTEKFYEPLLSGSVPVYLGASNIDKYSPGHNSFINVIDFNSPKELADVINELCEDEKKYNNYFDWKNHPLLDDFMQLLETQKIHPFIRLAESVQRLKDKILCGPN